MIAWAGPHLIDCPRAGSAPLTIRGRDFAGGKPTVLIGEVPCRNVTVIQAHFVTYCELPPGLGVRVPVLLLQDQGSLAKNVLEISYQQCAAGTVATASVNCINCTAGTFASLVGMSECQPCPGGQFGATTGLSSCEVRVKKPLIL